MSSDHIKQGELLEDMNDLERTLHETQNASNRRKRKVRGWVDATENLDGLAGVDSGSKTHRKMLYEAAAPHQSRLKKWASRTMYATLVLGVIGAIGFMTSRSYETPEEVAQREADAIAASRLITAADTDCDFEMSGNEFRRLYARRTGEEFPHNMRYGPLVVVVSADKLDNTITYRHPDSSAFMRGPHHYIYMSRDTALGLAEDAPDHCRIPVPDFL